MIISVLANQMTPIASEQWDIQEEIWCKIAKTLMANSPWWQSGSRKDVTASVCYTYSFRLLSTHAQFLFVFWSLYCLIFKFWTFLFIISIFHWWHFDSTDNWNQNECDIHVKTHSCVRLKLILLPSETLEYRNEVEQPKVVNATKEYAIHNSEWLGVAKFRHKRNCPSVLISISLNTTKIFCGSPGVVTVHFLSLFAN